MEREQKITRELEAKREMSENDELTGLRNRRAFDQACEAIELEGWLDQITVVMMDVNGLKRVNDTLGHNAGDELIIGAAGCMTNALGEYGKIYRVGGDEFAALLYCTAEQLERAFKTFDHVTESWKGVHVKELAVSKGAASGWEFPQRSTQELKELADQRMYEDKEAYYQRTGRDRRWN